jgi:hypothetical protein
LRTQSSYVVVPESNLNQYLDYVRRSDIRAFEARSWIGVSSAVAAAPEERSRGITKFSFIVYGDTRGRRDGIEVQYEHSLVVDSMLAQMKELQNTD